MENDLLTVEEVAEMMDMHTRTIRRYIKEGRLTAAKFGGQWRIRKNDLVQMMSDEEFLKDSKDIWESNVEEFLAEKGKKLSGKIQVCAVSDIYVNNAVEANTVATEILAMMNNPDQERKESKMQYMFDDKTLKVRFIFWGNPAFISKLIFILAKYDYHQED